MDRNVAAPLCVCIRGVCMHLRCVCVCVGVWQGWEVAAMCVRVNTKARRQSSVSLLRYTVQFLRDRISQDCSSWQGSWARSSSICWRVGTPYLACFSVGTRNGTQAHTFGRQALYQWNPFPSSKMQFVCDSKPFVKVDSPACVLPCWLTAAGGQLVTETFYPSDGLKDSHRYGDTTTRTE